MNDVNNKEPNKPHHRKRLSMSPLTPDQALAAALQVKPEDVDAMEKRYQRAKKRRAAKRAKKK